MHWLNDRISNVFVDMDEYRGLQEAQEDTTEPTGMWASQRDARAAFLKALGKLIQEVTLRPGVRAAFVEHDGLIIDWAGDATSADALAAMARVIIRTTREATHGASIGALRQVLIQGADNKLAIILLGDVAIGIFAPANVNLSEALSK